jgi:1-deoxy-D-xylulose-5-phosphate reductoisomerase
MFIDHQVGYLDIIKLNAACCEAHKSDLVAMPDLDEIVHYDQWARRWVKEQVESGAFKPKVVLSMAA